MIKFSKMIYSLGVFISLSAYIGAASAVMDPVSPKSKKIESSDKSKNMRHEKIYEKRNIYLGNMNLPNSTILGPTFESEPYIDSESEYEDNCVGTDCLVTKFSKPNMSVRKKTTSLYPIIINSDSDSESDSGGINSSVNEYSTLFKVMDVKSDLYIVNSSITSQLGKTNKCCKNESYAYSVMHLFAKGFPKKFRQTLESISLNLSLGTADYTNEKDLFMDYFHDLIAEKLSFNFIYVNDRFFRLFDLAVDLIKKQNAKCDNITESFLCTNHLMQDPVNFITGILTMLGLEKSPLITSQIDTKLWKSTDDDSGEIGNDIEELALVQTVSLKKRYSRKVSELLESIYERRYSATQIRDVHFHVDTSKFTYFIAKYEIFEGDSDEKRSIDIGKVDNRVRNIINLSEDINIKAYDIKKIGLVDKKEALNYELTPIAAISHKGDALKGGHFIAKILTEKTGEEESAKWTMYDKDKEVSALKRSELATDYDDYIVVYKVVNSNVIFNF